MKLSLGRFCLLLITAMWLLMGLTACGSQGGPAAAATLEPTHPIVKSTVDAYVTKYVGVPASALDVPVSGMGRELGRTRFPNNNFYFTYRAFWYDSSLRELCYQSPGKLRCDVPDGYVRVAFEVDQSTGLVTGYLVEGF